jgi:quaternary ammonium compound-resistance protein SugE
MKYWIYLVSAAIIEVFWMYCLKFMDVKAIKLFFTESKFTSFANYVVLLPLIGYILFGITNVTLFSLSMKGISAATAFAVWMGLTLIFSVGTEAFFYKTVPDIKQLLFMGFILIGVIGLKLTTKS